MRIIPAAFMMMACATVNAQTIGDAIRNAVKTHTDMAAGFPSAQGQGGSTAKGTRLKDTPLDKLFEKYPAAQSNPEFPKVALSFSYPDWVVEPDGVIGKMKANQCLQYSAVLWKDAKSSQRFDNLVVCPNEFVRVPHDGLRAIWPSFSIPGKTSGQVRTDGPTPPHFPFPTDGKSKNWLTYGGVWYLGAVMAGMGYDWNYAEDKRRVWVVKLGDLAPAPGTDSAAAEDAAVATGAVAATCKSANFTQARYNAIKQGMSLDKVNQALGCAPDPEFTRRSEKMTMYMWQVTEGGLVAAKHVQVFFDGSGTKTLTTPSFKSASGF